MGDWLSYPSSSLVQKNFFQEYSLPLRDMINERPLCQLGLEIILKCSSGFSQAQFRSYRSAYGMVRSTSRQHRFRQAAISQSFFQQKSQTAPSTPSDVKDSRSLLTEQRQLSTCSLEQSNKICFFQTYPLSQNHAAATKTCMVQLSNPRIRDLKLQLRTTTG